MPYSLEETRIILRQIRFIQATLAITFSTFRRMVITHYSHQVGWLRWAVPTLSGCISWNMELDLTCGSRYRLFATVSARTLGHRQSEGTAMLFGCFRVSDQVVLILLREMFPNGVNFSDDRIVPCLSCIHSDTSISSNGVTSSGSL